MTDAPHEIEVPNSVSTETSITSNKAIQPVTATKRLSLTVVGERYMFVVIWLAMAAVFAIAKPTYFLEVSTLQVITSSAAIYVLLGLGMLAAAVVGEFDLSTAFVMGLAATLVPTLVSIDGMNIVLAVVISLMAAGLCGLLTATLVVVFGVNSFITTLGFGTALVGIAEGFSNGAPVAGLSQSFGNIAIAHFLGLELIVWYALALALLMGYVLAFTALGRHMLFVGANPEVARLAGVPVNRIRFGAYAVGALIAGVAGVLLTAQLRGFQASSANDYLLPAIAALFLSSIVIRPGRFNPIGVLIAAGFIATGTFGLELMGSTGWTQQLFYGGSLVLAIVIVSTVRRHTKAA